MKYLGACDPAPARRLSRTLGLWDLVFIGIIMVQPTAPMTAYGVFYEKADHTKLVGLTWLAVGLVFGAWSFDAPPEEEAPALIKQKVPSQPKHER